MITIENLKENRNEIISEITNILERNNVWTTKENIVLVMNKMVGLIGWSGIESTNVIDFVFETIDSTEIIDEMIMKQGRMASRRMEEINIESSRKLMQNI